MATFNQQNQTINTQYNADIITNGQSTKADFLIELQHLQKQLNEAIELKLITGENAIDAEMHIKKVVLKAKEKCPDKKTLLSHLASAKDLVASTDKIAAGISSIITTVGEIF